MRARLLDVLACPRCGAGVRAWPIDQDRAEIRTGLLECEGGHLYPVLRSIPRMFPHALAEAAPRLRAAGVPFDHKNGFGIAGVLAPRA